MWRYAASKRIQAKAISSVGQSNRTYRPLTNFYRHNNPLLLQPPIPTQIRCHEVPVQQTKHTTCKKTNTKLKKTLRNIMHNNNFPIHPHHPPPPRQITITPDKRMTTTIQKWATFTYIGKETTFITNLFKKTRPRDRIANQQHHPEVVNAETKDIR